MAARARDGASSDGDGGTLRDFEHSLPMALLRAREAAMGRFRPMLRSHGLTEQQWRVVRVLAEKPGIDAGSLAKRSYLLAPSLTRILQHLENRRLIRRDADESDQRRSVFSLTGKGRRLFDAVAPDSELLYRDIEREFGRRNLNAMYRILAEFERALEPGADSDCNARGNAA